MRTMRIKIQFSFIASIREDCAWDKHENSGAANHPSSEKDIAPSASTENTDIVDTKDWDRHENPKRSNNHKTYNTNDKQINVDTEDFEATDLINNSDTLGSNKQEKVNNSRELS